MNERTATEVMTMMIPRLESWYLGSACENKRLKYPT